MLIVLLDCIGLSNSMIKIELNLIYTDKELVITAVTQEICPKSQITWKLGMPQIYFIISKEYKFSSEKYIQLPLTESHMISYINFSLRIKVIFVPSF